MSQMPTKLVVYLSVFALTASVFSFVEPTETIAATPKATAPYFGYFSSGHHNGNSNLEVSDHSNLVWIWVLLSEESGTQPFVKELEWARSQGLAVIADVKPAFWAQKIDLATNYSQNWQTTASLLKPFVDDGTIVAFYHIDEPEGYVANGDYDATTAWSRIETVNATIKSSFPNTPIALTIHGWSLRDETTPAWFRIPNGIDWVGYDCYWSYDSCYGYSVTEYLERLKKLINPNQKIYLVPAGILAAENNNAQGASVVNDIAKRHIELFKSDEQFIAMMPYTWNLSGPYVGVKDVPLLKSTYREIGLQFKNGDFASPTLENVKISSPKVKADGQTVYTITISANDSQGGANISHEYALINIEGLNAGQRRGNLGWYHNAEYTGWDLPAYKDKMKCNSGIAAILPDEAQGQQYIELDSCSTTISGNTRTVEFKVRFNTVFTAPVSNSIRGEVLNLQNNWDQKNFESIFSVEAPVVASSPSPAPAPAPSSGSGSGYTYSPSPAPSPTSTTTQTQTTTSIPDGTLVLDNGTVYVIEFGKKRGITSMAVLNGLGYKLAHAITANTSSVPVGPVISTASQRHTRGTLINDNGTIYYLGAGMRYAFPSQSVFLSWGCKFEHVVPANQFDLQIPKGPIVEYKK